MTDAALAVTQSAVEQFTERYLITHGCTIDKRGTRWEVTVPEGATTDVAIDEVVLVCSTDPEEIGGDEPLNPESSFFHALLEEASTRKQTGKISITADDSDIIIPPWLANSEVSVESVDFTPYYDRTAVVVLFRVSIETVSEYQTEFLRATAMDTRSEEALPGLVSTFLSKTLPSQEALRSESTRMDRDTAEGLLKRVRDNVVADLQPEVDEIHAAASRSADAEVEEFRQLQQHRINELEEEETRLSGRIDDLSTSLEESDNQVKRAEALKKRRDLRSEFDEVESQLKSIRTRREDGFPEKQREIRDRHSLEVVVEPVTLTEIEYEQGEIDFELDGETTKRTLTVGYGSGIGVTDSVHCKACGRKFSAQNTLRLVNDETRCTDC